MNADEAQAQSELEQQRKEMGHLNYIQCKLNAPKSQYNSFGKYNYRNCEDILMALKPHLDHTGCTVILSDDIILVHDRVYVKAVARLMDGDNIVGETQAFAREPLNKKGMDDSQITGTASSYARKYALNGLFLIDDNKGADTDEHANQSNNAKPRVPHQKHFEKQVDAMRNAGNPQLLKTLATSAYNYFKGWEEMSYCDKVTSEYKKLETNFKTEV